MRTSTSIPSKSSSKEFHGIKGKKRERLIFERKSRCLTQSDLGEIIGCSKTTVSHLELGRMKPGLELSIELENYFGLPFEILFPDL